MKTMRRFRTLLTALLLMAVTTTTCFAQQKRIKTIVTTDGEIDDVDTFIRMLLYSNEFDLEGLIYSSSMWHYSGDGLGTTFTSEMPMTKELYGPLTALRWPGVNWMQELILDYARVYDHLILHDPNYPSPEKLMAMVRVGNIEFEGEMEKVTLGSEWIKNKLLQEDIDELFLQAWGGTNTIARALKSIEEEYSASEEWETIYEAVSRKSVIYTIMDQDATYKNYIAQRWPNIRVYYNAAQFAAFAYPWKRVVPKNLQKYLEGSFMKPIITNSGQLLKKYYSYGDGQKQEGDEEHIHGDPTKLKNAQWGSFEKYDFISEGDTPAYLHLVDLGLDNYDHPWYGGWGGRFVPSQEVAHKYEDGDAAADFNPETGVRDPMYPQTRWIAAIQNDFAARAAWCVSDFEQANHAPKISIQESPIQTVKRGAKVNIHFTSTDVDGDAITHKVWNYTDVSTADATVAFTNTEATIRVSKKAQSGSEIHLIVEGSDSGTPPLTSYRRVLFKVE